MADTTPTKQSDPPLQTLDNLLPTSSSYAPIITPDTWDPESNVALPTNVRSALTIRSLMAASMHLGHAPKHWNPHMLPFIYGERNGIHIINLEHTLSHLRRAINVCREVAFANGKIVFVGTKRAIHKITVDAADRAGEGAYYVLDWRGGIVTNKERVLRRSSGFDPDRVVQMETAVATAQAGRNKRGAKGQQGGFEEQDAGRKSRQPHVHIPDLMILLDYPNTMSAAREANHCNIPIIALCDTDCDPALIQYPIPGNDDALASVELVAGVLSLACREGRMRRHVVGEKVQRQEPRQFKPKDEEKY
ncbi:hypothetical protein HK097_005574 [Rhizophlyctis rosea]|uniref:30S ribosomal protein S2 n=1 Tax=Rhizophlyctis rosea TaxID=64517 RepID=A0AAD5SD85_9FUNG|nr:hypothetical protein HK097_005574 [Rhizophlyctis rosea]